MNLGPDAPIGFLHAGRLGASLAVAISAAGYRVTAVCRSHIEDAERVASRIDQAVAVDDPQAVVDAAQVVFITASDHRIAPVSQGLRYRPGQAVIHCSGATPVSALDDALGQGAFTGGFHPVQTFPDEYGEHRIRGVTFGVEAEDDTLRTWLKRLAGDLGGESIQLTGANRALYHTAGTLASPLVAGMIGLAADLWAELGLSRTEALRALGPLLTSTVEQVLAKGIPTALTGSFVRGDVETVARHLEALETASPDLLRAYASVALAHLPIAAEQGKLDDATRARLEKMLRSSAALPGA